MSFFKANNFFSSPDIGFSKYECSPLVTLEKYTIFSRKLGSERINKINLVNFHNLQTPSKDDFNNIESENNLKEANNQKVKMSFEKRKSIFNTLINLPNQEEFSKKQKSNLNINPHIISCIKKNNLNNLYMNHENEVSEGYLKRKRIRTKLREYPSREFRLDEIFVDGKRINNILNFDDDSFNSNEYSHFVEIIRPIYDKGFKILNPKSKSISEKKRTENKEDFLQIFEFQNSIRNEKFKKKFFNEANKIFPSMNFHQNLDIGSLYNNELYQTKILFKTLQSDFIMKREKVVNKDLLCSLKSQISFLNDFSDLLISLLPKSTTKSKENKNSSLSEETFECNLCDRKFLNGQGLGGHMSKAHPQRSDQYKEKMKIRNSRAESRAVLHMAKSKILFNNGYDYDSLRNSNKKEFIKRIIFENRIEFKRLLCSMKSDLIKK